MTWTVRDIERDRDIIDAIDGHDDCAAAIKAGAYLEDRLASVLRACDIPPPSSFWGKIDTAHRHGLFTEELAESLHTIRKIRNTFAHNLAPLNFRSPSIADLCKKLFSIEKMRTLPAAIAETFHESHVLVKALDLFVAPMLELPDTPRNKYMNAVKVLLLCLEFFKAATVMGNNDFIEIVAENILVNRNLRGQ